MVLAMWIAACSDVSSDGLDTEIYSTDMTTDGDVDADADADADAEADHEADHGDSVGTWLPFLSLRFWTFFAAFFGLTGVALHAFDVNWVATLIASVSVGATTGTMVSWMVRRMKMAQTDSTVKETEIEGSTARVLLPISPEIPGKIRVNMKGTSVDIAARTTEGLTIERGTEVLVVRMGDGEAVVTALRADDDDPDNKAQREMQRKKRLQATRQQS